MPACGLDMNMNTSAPTMLSIATVPCSMPSIRRRSTLFTSSMIARHQIARSALVELIDRQPLQARIDIAAHVVNDVLLEANC